MDRLFPKGTEIMTIPYGVIASGGSAAAVVDVMHRELGITGNEPGLGIAISDFTTRNACFPYQTTTGFVFNFMEPGSGSDLIRLKNGNHADLAWLRPESVKPKGIGQGKRPANGYFGFSNRDNRNKSVVTARQAFDKAQNPNDKNIKKGAKHGIWICGAGGGSGPVLSVFGRINHQQAERNLDTNEDWHELFVISSDAYAENDDMLRFYHANQATLLRGLSRLLVYGSNDPNPHLQGSYLAAPDGVLPGFFDSVTIFSNRTEDNKLLSYDLLLFLIGLLIRRSQQLSFPTDIIRELRIERDDNNTGKELKTGRSRRFGSRWISEVVYAKDETDAIATVKRRIAGCNYLLTGDGSASSYTGDLKNALDDLRLTLANRLKTRPKSLEALTRSFAQNPSTELDNNIDGTRVVFTEAINSQLEGYAEGNAFGPILKNDLDVLTERMVRTISDLAKQGNFRRLAHHLRELYASFNMSISQNPLRQGWETKISADLQMIISRKAEIETLRQQAEAKNRHKTGWKELASEAAMMVFRDTVGMEVKASNMQAAEDDAVVRQYAGKVASYFHRLQQDIIEYSIASRVARVGNHLVKFVIAPLIHAVIESVKGAEAQKRVLAQEIQGIRQTVVDTNKLRAVVQYLVLPSDNLFANQHVAQETLELLAESVLPVADIVNFASEEHVETKSSVESRVYQTLQEITATEQISFLAAVNSDPEALQRITELKRARVLTSFNGQEMNLGESVRRYAVMIYPPEFGVIVEQMGVTAPESGWRCHVMPDMLAITVMLWGGYIQASAIDSTEKNEANLDELRDEGGYDYESRFFCPRIASMPRLCSGDIEVVRQDAYLALIMEPEVFKQKALIPKIYEEGEFDSDNLPAEVFSLFIDGEWITGEHKELIELKRSSPFRMYGSLPTDKNEKRKGEWTFRMTGPQGKFIKDIFLGRLPNVAVELIAANADMRNDLRKYVHNTIKAYDAWVYTYLQWFTLHLDSWIKKARTDLNPLESTDVETEDNQKIAVDKANKSSKEEQVDQIPDIAETKTKDLLERYELAEEILSVLEPLAKSKLWASHIIRNVPFRNLSQRIRVG